MLGDCTQGYSLWSHGPVGLAMTEIFESEVSMDIRLNDILTMKKAHPCGEKRWQVLRTGADFRLKCLGCGHEVMTPRFKAEKNIRSVEHQAEAE